MTFASSLFVSGYFYHAILRGQGLLSDNGRIEAGHTLPLSTTMATLALILPEHLTCLASEQTAERFEAYS